MTLELPAELELAVETTPAELEAQIRLMAAMKMFELGKLSWLLMIVWDVRRLGAWV